jgi:glycosyltransferase involved in cell wall biosynthesis
MQQPLVSICIPAFNAEKFLCETLESVFNQSYANLEIIVVDDGSTDNTAFVAQRFEEKKVRYFYQENKGAAAARNVAFSKSTGKYIKFLDADDLLESNCIERQANRLFENNNCIASGKWGRFYNENASDFAVTEEDKLWKDLDPLDWIITSLLETGANMMQPGIFLIPRAIAQKAGPWNEQLSLIDDFEYMVRVFLASERILFCEDAILKYRSCMSDHLSGKISEAHMQSAFRAVNLVCDRILSKRNDKVTRLVCANMLERWAYTFYPVHPKLLKRLEQRIKELGGAKIPVMGGPAFRSLSSIIGWKRATWVRRALGSKA